MTVDSKEEHPAKFSSPIMDVISDTLSRYLPHGSTILDPFAGIGGIHQLAVEHEQLAVAYDTYAVELEPEWAAQSAELGPTWCGDLFKFNPRDLHYAHLNGDGEFWPGSFDAIVTSPTYGNRLADNHNARDSSKRITYRHKLGRQLSPNNSGGLQWGERYRSFHRRAWRRVVEHMLSPVGEELFVLNMSNHIRGGLVMPVVRWHREFIKSLGMELVEDIKVETQRMGFGQNGQARVPYEHVLVFRGRES